MRKYLPAAVCLLLCLGINLYYRAYPILLPQVKEQATQYVNVEVQRKIALQLNQQYPGLPHLAKSKLFPKALADYTKANSRLIRQQIRQEYDRLRDPFQDRTGQTYFMELDCWHWARYVENIDKHGYPGDTIVDGRQIDTYMLFPDGSPLLWNTFLFYLSWFCYKIFSFFYAVPLLVFLFYLPLFYAAVFIIVLYGFCYRYWDNIAATVACLFAGLSPIFIPRSSAGWFDMDILSLIFPVLIVGSYLSAYHEASLRKQLLRMVVAAFWLGLFCATWVAWGFILFILAVYEVLVIANAVSERIQYKEPVAAFLKAHAALPAAFLASGVVWIVLFCGLQPLQTLYGLVREAMILNKPLTASVWPNVLSTVGELKTVDYAGIAKTQGGVFLFITGLASMLAIFLRIRHYQGVKRDAAILLVIWFMVMFFFSAHGVRFTIFLCVPLGIFLGWGLSEANSFLSLKKHKMITLPVLSLVTFAVVVTMALNAHRSANGTLPLMQDDWYRVLTDINKHTPEDAVINSWWDFGDWFKTVARRPVIFDGQSQNTPRAHWMARVLLTSSEKEAVGILRMLNNGGNKAFEIIDRHVHDQFLSIALVKRLLALDRPEAEVLLRQYLPAEAVDQVASIMYDRPSHAVYFVVDSSMTGKIGAISFLGNWDFGRLYLARSAHKDGQEKMLRTLDLFGIDQQQAEAYVEELPLLSPQTFDRWVSRYLSVVAIVSQNRTDDDIVMFPNGYLYNPRQKTIHMFSPDQRRYRKPRSLVLVRDKTVTQIDYPDSDMDHSALLIENNQGHKLVMLSPELASSMFVRLLFLNGAGLGHFRLFTESSSDRERIAVFEVVWEKEGAYGTR